MKKIKSLDSAKLYAKLAWKMFLIDLNKELAYKTNLVLKIFAVFFGDIVGSLIGLIIYSTTTGIPGWSLEEFLFFQGTLLLAFGLGRTLVMRMCYEVFEAVQKGQFDKFLLKPFHSLLYLLAISVNWEGFAEILVGLTLITYSLNALSITITVLSLAIYLLLIICAFLFQIGIFTMISAGSFMVVKNEALIQLYFRMSDFARYPMNIYGFGLKFLLTFIFPMAIVSFYPSEALLRGISIATFAKATIPAIIFFLLSIFIWNRSIRKYVSAGG